MPALEDPAAMAPAERLAEVSAILARGILRLHSRAALPAENSHDSAQSKLDSGPETGPHANAVNDGGDPDRRRIRIAGQTWPDRSGRCKGRWRRTRDSSRRS